MRLKGYNFYQKWPGTSTDHDFMVQPVKELEYKPLRIARTAAYWRSLGLTMDAIDF
jgi:hypothetical protein